MRCPWAESGPLERKHHDEEWGRPCRDERHLFKMLILEGQQAGLSWSTILKKMDTLSAAYDDFDPKIIINYDDEKIESLLKDPGVIRNRLKVLSVISNAKAYFKLCETQGSLSKFLWSYVDNQPIINNWTEMGHLPAQTPLSDKISKDLKDFGFKFVGSTIIYSLMQAVGLVNDHIVDCEFR
ncbi:MAG: DNA-3-methyladenine glycosylase I [Deltaproteobacteria bacterium]|jgi:DNA-3-methyladenine glycosylase I|nr:DNA-3-methyladenine glycosylase I [Deltaproteobacteria bacterium]